MLSNWVKQILLANVYDVAIESPLEPAPKISRQLGNNIRFKREDLQPVFSFKLRGAYNRISQLTESQRQRGVICASAGNHAQGVALSGQKLGVPTIIVMPTTTPDIKVEAVRRLGGTVVLVGESFDESNRYAQQRAEDDGLVFIPPYDDELVIAGQGTIANEILRQWRDVEYVFVAVGGGGLLAGIAAYFGEIAPHVKVVAVEYDESACLKAALDAGERVILPSVGLFADGTAVAQIGALPFDVIRLPKSDGSAPMLIEPDVVLVNTDEICVAVKDTYNDNRSIVEPSGALALAGIKKYVAQHGIQDKNIVSIVCGANMNFERLHYITERTELGEAKEAVFAVNLPEKKGAFLEFCRTLAGKNITEFNYRFSADDLAQVYVGVSLKRGEKERLDILEKLAQNYDTVDLSDDKISKLHIRHMIGGYAHLTDERLFSVEFLERPNSLLNFLEKLGTEYNISLFHYRNHNAAVSNVLIGLQSPYPQHDNPEQDPLWQRLTEIDYPFEEVTDNIGYRRFLR